MPQDFDEWDDASTCIECGEVLWPDVDRSFASGPDAYLCFTCAEKRGGVYDASRDRWSVPPSTTGLPDERRPHV